MILKKQCMCPGTWGMAAPTAFATDAKGGRMTEEAPSNESSHRAAPPPTTTTGTSPVSCNPFWCLLLVCIRKIERARLHFVRGKAMRKGTHNHNLEKIARPTF